MAGKKQLQHCLWLVDTIYSSGSISLEEINRKWKHSSLNEEPDRCLDRRTFIRHREDIEELFGIRIICDKPTNTYMVDNSSDLRGNDIRGWVLNTFSLGNIANMSGELRERVIFEDFPEGMRMLSPIARAMESNNQLEITYCRFGGESHTFRVAPYCLKAHQRRWYLVAKPMNHPEEKEPRVYALDRVSDLKVLEIPFRMPKRFRADRFFAGYYGVDRRETPCEINIRTDANTAAFLHSLPLHPSQKERRVEDGRVVFSYFVAPTIDFIQQLRLQGPSLEVLSPDWLRERFRQEAKDLMKMYGTDE